jgi:hypothetical protein
MARKYKRRKLTQPLVETPKPSNNFDELVEETEKITKRKLKPSEIVRLSEVYNKR